MTTGETDWELSLKTQAVMAEVLDDEEIEIILRWAESPNLSDADLAGDLGMSRRSFKRQMSVAMAKLRENL
jgi:DNA-directed RNA polymerase specialized sigma24 family protein